MIGPMVSGMPLVGSPPYMTGPPSMAITSATRTSDLVPAGLPLRNWVGMSCCSTRSGIATMSRSLPRQRTTGPVCAAVENGSWGLVTFPHFVYVFAFVYERDLWLTRGVMDSNHQLQQPNRSPVART